MKLISPLYFSKMFFLTLVLISTFFVGCTQDKAETWPGYVEADYINVTAEVNGTLKHVFVSKGDVVSQGSKLFSIDENPEKILVIEMKAQLAANKEKIKEAKAQSELAGKELTRIKRLAKEDYSSWSALDVAKAKETETAARLAYAKEALKVQQAKLDSALWTLSRKHPLAQTPGTVDDIWFELGEWVATGKTVMRLRPTGSAKLKFFVPEPALTSINIGKQVLVEVDGLQSFPAIIEAIATEPEFAPPVLYSEGSREKLVFWVEARPAASVAESLHPGLPVEVYKK